MVSETETVLEKAYELITEDLVKEALEKNKGQDAKLISFHLKPFTKKGDNFLSIIVSVEVRYKKKGSDYEESYVAKMNPCLPVNPLTEVIKFMFPIETDMLMIIIEGMNEQLDKLNLPHIRTPKLYARTLETGREAFITENLRKRGYIMHDKMKGLDLDHSVLVLKELGRFHASSLLYEKTLHPKTIEESFNFKDPRYFDHDIIKFYEKLTASFANIIIDILKKEGPKYETCVEWLQDHREKMSKYVFDGFIPEKPFDVLAHGDCWNNNFLFRYDENDIPIDVRFVDLQCSRKASPATDILYFYTSLSGDFRVEKMNYMVSIYYKSFCEVLSRAEKSPSFSYEELILEVKNRRIFGLSVGVLVLSVVLSEETDALYDKTLPDNCSEKQNKSVKAFLDSENPLQKRLLSMFDEFIEYDLFN